MAVPVAVAALDDDVVPLELQQLRGTRAVAECE